MTQHRLGGEASRLYLLPEFISSMGEGLSREKDKRQVCPTDSFGENYYRGLVSVVLIVVLPFFK